MKEGLCDVKEDIQRETWTPRLEKEFYSILEGLDDWVARFFTQ